LTDGKTVRAAKRTSSHFETTVRGVECGMIADLSILPLGKSEHTSETLAEVLKAIDEAGIAYQLTPTTTCLEGSWEKITTVARLCHEIARRHHSHVVTELRIEDDGGDRAKLQHNVESVEEKAGRTFNKDTAGGSASLIS
jgi:uncharacterized protein (TIGR00106 family)